MAMERANLIRTAVLIGGAVLGIALLFAGNSRSDTATAEAVEMTDTEAYVQDMEEKIRELCRRVEGVGEVSVVVSLESGWRRTYGRESGSYLSVASLSGSGSVCLSEEPPVIGGIAIVCDGGGDPIVRQRLVNLLRAAYGIGSNKIYVAPAQNGAYPHSGGG